MCYTVVMRLTFKYRLFPTKAQRTALQRSLDACRWVYNQTLEVRRDAWEEDRQSLSLYATNKLLTQWKREKPALQDAFSQALQDAQKRVDLAFQAFYQRAKRARVRRGEEKVGYPRFKGFMRYQSMTYKQYGNGVRLEDDGCLYLAKIGLVKMKKHRPLRGEVKTVTIQRDRLGNWYACFSCLVDPRPLPPVTAAVGVDLGLRTFAVLSNGETIPRQRWMARDEKDLRRIQRQVSRLPQGSAARRGAVRALNHVHQRIANRRRDFAHQVSREIVDRYQVLIFEDLDIPDMQRNGYKTINKGIADVAWGQMVQFTTYKAEDAGRTMLRVNPRGTGARMRGKLAPVVMRSFPKRCRSEYMIVPIAAWFSTET